MTRVGLFLEPPHAQLIAEGQQTAIVREFRDESNVNVPVYFFEDQVCYGICVLKDPRPITLEQFKEMTEKHQTKNPGWKTFFIQELKVQQLFVPPKAVEFPVQPTNWIAEWNFTGQECDSYPGQLDDSGVTLDHAICHTMFTATAEPEMMKTLLQLHCKLTGEIRNRGLESGVKTDTLDDLCAIQPGVISENVDRHVKLIKDPEHYDPKVEPEDRLLDDHRIMHMMWANIRRGLNMGFWTKEHVLEFHKKIVESLISRFHVHHYYRSDLDKDVASEKPVKLRHPKCRTCMECNQPATVEVLWAEGKAYACFCDKHFEEWKKKLNSMSKTGTNEGDVVRVTKLREFAEVKPGGIEKFETEVTLEQVVTPLKDFVLKDPFVDVMGGVVVHGSTTGDIDFLIHKQNQPSFDIPVEFRIYRQFPKELWPRVSFHYDNYSGPFTDHIHLYRLVSERIPDEIHRMQTVNGQYTVEVKSATVSKQADESQKEDKIEPFRFLHALKVGRYEETYSLEEVAQYFKPEDYPLVLQKKYDGNRMLVFKFGDKVQIWTEDGTDITRYFPTAVHEIQQWPMDCILDNETEGWFEKHHITREDVAGYIHRVKTGQMYKDTSFFFNTFDCLWFNWKGQSKHDLNMEIGDIHKQPYSVRLQYLDLLPFKQSTMAIPAAISQFNKSPSLIVKNSEELLTESKKILHEATKTEGVMYKRLNSDYPLSGITSAWFKYKIFAEVHAIVWKFQETKSPGVVNVLVAVRIPMGWVVPKNLTAEINNKGYMYIGKTFNVLKSKHPQLKEGVIVTVYFHTLNHYTRSTTGEQYVHIYEPRFYEVRPDQTMPDDASDMITIAKKAKILEEKIVKLTRPPSEEVQVKTRPIPMDDLAHPWVLQFHQAASYHGDIRIGMFENGKMTHLEGFTLAGILPPGQKRVFKVSESRAIAARFPMGFKFNNRPGMDGRKLLAFWKSVEPIEWLHVQGVTAPGEVGATKQYPGVFLIFDHGESCYLGAQKPYFHEFFFDGKKINGRWVLRALAAAELSEKPGTETFVWTFWKPDDQTPYVLGARARTTGWIPPYGMSCLPRPMRDEVPRALRYWLVREPAKRKQVRDSLIALWVQEKKITKGQ